MSLLERLGLTKLDELVHAQANNADLKKKLDIASGEAAVLKTQVEHLLNLASGVISGSLGAFRPTGDERIDQEFVKRLNLKFVELQGFANDIASLRERLEQVRQSVKEASKLVEEKLTLTEKGRVQFPRVIAAVKARKDVNAAAQMNQIFEDWRIVSVRMDESAAKIRKVNEVMADVDGSFLEVEDVSKQIADAQKLLQGKPVPANITAANAIADKLSKRLADPRSNAKLLDVTISGLLSEIDVVEKLVQSFDADNTKLRSAAAHMAMSVEKEGSHVTTRAAIKAFLAQMNKTYKDAEQYRAKVYWPNHFVGGHDGNDNYEGFIQQMTLAPLRNWELTPIVFVGPMLKQMQKCYQNMMDTRRMLGILIARLSAEEDPDLTNAVAELSRLAAEFDEEITSYNAVVPEVERLLKNVPTNHQELGQWSDALRMVMKGFVGQRKVQHPYMWFAAGGCRGLYAEATTVWHNAVAELKKLL